MKFSLPSKSLNYGSVDKDKDHLISSPSALRALDPHNLIRVNTAINPHSGVPCTIRFIISKFECGTSLKLKSAEAERFHRSSWLLCPQTFPTWNVK